MDTDKLLSLTAKLPKRLHAPLEKGVRKLPGVQQLMEQEYQNMLADMEESLHPYRERFAAFSAMPDRGLADDEVLQMMAQVQEEETERWQAGYASGAVYHGDPEHIAFMNRVYAIHSQMNPLHADLWPSAVKYEAEVVAMTADMLNAREAQRIHPATEVCGSVTSGGTESILMAMKAYRDWARAEKGIKKPNVVLPISAHPAFDKAAQYFGIQLIRTPVDHRFQADVKAMEKAINKNTIALVGSAPGFPHGVIDPIPEMSGLALKRGVGFHTDACLGGFIIPWAEKLGYPVPVIDFRLPGVTSISVDTHKYGYAAKGTSVALYRTPALRRYQYFTATDWPGGLYASPTMAGSKPGALIAVAWAVMLKIGREGYLEATRRILETGEQIREGVESIPGLYVLGDPLWVIAFASDEVDIYRVMDAMAHRGWSLNGLQFPPAVHMAVTLRHTQPGVAERFLSDLAESVEEVRSQPETSGGMAPIYGMAASIPFRGMVADILRRYMDLLYRA
ncbi:MAG: aminotransferase class V-fold PLP-dependent enzyme [Chloroflexi bacterium]|nr:aminotransferase class V-fold PLP-dependent enzyme [Chloroflexota bacterium]